MSKDKSVTIPAVDEYEKRRARGIAAMEEAMAANKVVEENQNGLVDPYKDQFAVSLPKSNEIDYTQSNADRVIKDYQDAELAGVVKKTEQKSAPVVDENVPIIDETLEYEAPTEEMEKFEEEKTQAQWQKDYLDSIWSKEDEEAAEKKKKAAKWITAAQMLGDSIAALGNSYFTAKGANAMKVEPGAQKAAAATSQLEQDIRNAREKAAKAKYDATLKKYEMEMEKTKADRAQANADREHKLAVDKFNYQKEKDARTEASIMDRWMKEFEVSKKTAEANLQKTLKDNLPYRFDTGDGFIDIPKEFVNEQTIGAIFDLLPAEIKETAGSPRYGKDMMQNTVLVGYDHPDLKGMLAAIGMGMQYANVRQAVKRLGEGKGEIPAADDTIPGL